MLAFTFNQLKLEQVCLSILELSEVQTSAKDRTKFENKLTSNKQADYHLSKAGKTVHEAF